MKVVTEASSKMLNIARYLDSQTAPAMSKVRKRARGDTKTKE